MSLSFSFSFSLGTEGDLPADGGALNSLSGLEGKEDDVLEITIGLSGIGLSSGCSSGGGGGKQEVHGSLCEGAGEGEGERDPCSLLTSSRTEFADSLEADSLELRDSIVSGRVVLVCETRATHIAGCHQSFYVPQSQLAPLTFERGMTGR